MIKQRRDHGKTEIDLVRKYFGIIYDILKTEWVSEDFNKFVLAE
jgi:hypothetical protein